MLTQFEFWLDVGVVTAGVVAGLLWPKVDVYSWKFVLLFVSSFCLLIISNDVPYGAAKVDCGHSLFNDFIPCYVQHFLPRFGRPGDRHINAVLGFASFVGCLSAIVRALLKPRGQSNSR